MSESPIAVAVRAAQRPYARIEGDRVVEVFAPPSGASIEDCFHSGLMWVECDPNVMPGWDYDGATFSPPPPPPVPTVTQQAAALARGSCEVISSSRPALSAAYRIDPASRATMAEVVAGIAAGHGFPMDASPFVVHDAAGGAVEFTSTEDFMLIARALRNYCYALSLCAGGQSSELPAQPVVIA